MLSGQCFHNIVEQRWHKLSESSDGGRISTRFTSTFNLKIFTLLLRLFNPSTDNTIDDVDGTKLVRGRGFLEGAVEGLCDAIFSLQWALDVSC